MFFIKRAETENLCRGAGGHRSDCRGYMTFFQSRGFVKTMASITDVRLDSSGESAVCFPTVEYTVDGKTYTAKPDTGSGSYQVGQTVTVLNDPNNPSVAHGQNRPPHRGQHPQHPV